MKKQLNIQDDDTTSMIKSFPQENSNNTTHSSYTWDTTPVHMSLGSPILPPHLLLNALCARSHMLCLTPPSLLSVSNASSMCMKLTNPRGWLWCMYHSSANCAALSQSLSVLCATT